MFKLGILRTGTIGIIYVLIRLFEVFSPQFCRLSYHLLILSCPGPNLLLYDSVHLIKNHQMSLSIILLLDRPSLILRRPSPRSIRNLAPDALCHWLWQLWQCQDGGERGIVRSFGWRPGFRCRMLHAWRLDSPWWFELTGRGTALVDTFFRFEFDVIVLVHLPFVCLRLHKLWFAVHLHHIGRIWRFYFYEGHHFNFSLQV